MEILICKNKMNMVPNTDYLLKLASLLATLLITPTCFGQTTTTKSPSDKHNGPPPYTYFSDTLIIVLSVIAVVFFIVLFIILFRIIYKVETRPPPVQQRHGISENRNLRLENVSLQR